MWSVMCYHKPKATSLDILDVLDHNHTNKHSSQTITMVPCLMRMMIMQISIAYLHCFCQAKVFCQAKITLLNFQYFLAFFFLVLYFQAKITILNFQYLLAFFFLVLFFYFDSTIFCNHGHQISYLHIFCKAQEDYINCIKCFIVILYD